MPVFLPRSESESSKIKTVSRKKTVSRRKSRGNGEEGKLEEIVDGRGARIGGSESEGMQQSGRRTMTAHGLQGAAPTRALLKPLSNPENSAEQA